MALNPQSESEGIYMTEEEYLRTEPDSEVRREYIDGRAYAMAGASTNHVRITGNVFGEFRNHLKGKPCEAFMTDMKAKATKDYLYPDVVVACNHTEEKGITNTPVIIVEVLSQSTRKRDLTSKLIQYINLPSLQEYVLIEQDLVQVQVFRKRTNWSCEYFLLDDSVTFESIELTLTVEEIYDRVDNKEINEFRQTKLALENHDATENSAPH